MTRHPSSNSASAFPGIPQGPEPLTFELTGQPLLVRCATGENGRIIQKSEYYQTLSDTWQYRFDEKGHLLEAILNGNSDEAYIYNETGQRTGARTGGESMACGYNSQGQLVRNGNTGYEYDHEGKLARKTCRGLVTTYTYDETRLTGVTLPGGDKIRYEYGAYGSPNPQGPARKYVNEALVMEYKWQNLTRLASCRDYVQMLEFSFEYGERHCPSRVRIAKMIPKKGHHARNPSALTLSSHLKNGLRPVCLQISCDQVGTPRILTDANGEIVKHWRHDSFGNLMEEDGAGFRFPLGFASGLKDWHTGLVRFGFRDYDPLTGRFTCPDPLGDTGGDHDLYDYCVDDPVTMNDPAGLMPPLAAAGIRVLQGILGSAGISTAGFTLAGLGASGAQYAQTGETDFAALKAGWEVGPLTYGIMGGSGLGGLIPPALVQAAPVVGNAISRGVTKAGLPGRIVGKEGLLINAPDFIVPLVTDASPPPPSFAGYLGAGVDGLLGEVSRLLKKNNMENE